MASLSHLSYLSYLRQMPVLCSLQQAIELCSAAMFLV